MLSGQVTLSLTRTLADPNEVVLVALTAWLRDRAESPYREIESRTALWKLENLGRDRSMEVRSFAGKLGRFDIHRMDNQEILALIREAIRDGRVISVQKGAGKTAPLSATTELRRLVAQVEKATRGKLSYRGRNYRLLVDVELARLPDRDYYEIASQAEARAVLGGIAQESPASAEPIRKASYKLSKDWRPPLQPDGVVLLRRIPVQASAPKEEGPALTPSQMKALLTKSGWIEVEAVYEDEEEPYVGPYRLELPDGSIASGTFDQHGFLGKYEIEPGNCKITLADLATSQPPETASTGRKP